MSKTFLRRLIVFACFSSLLWFAAIKLRPFVADDKSFHVLLIIPFVITSMLAVITFCCALYYLYRLRG